jgi:acyl carrier protein
VDGAVTRVEDRIRQFIIDELSWEGDPAALSDDYDLISNDVLDSLGIEQVLAFIEDDLGCEVDDEDVVPENLESLRAIGDLVRSKGG